MFPIETRILIVDDMKTQCALMKGLLGKLGFKDILEASDGIDASKKLEEEKSAGRPVGLLISDWNMPKMSGIELLKKVRESESFRKLAFILITTESGGPHVEHAWQTGVSNYLVKPFTPEALEQVLQATFKGVRIEVQSTSRTEFDPSRFLEEISQAVVSTFKNMLHLEAKPRPRFKRGEGELFAADVAAVLPFQTKNLPGSVIFAMNTETYNSMLFKLFGKDASNEAMASRDAATEVLNVMMGKVRADFAPADPQTRKQLPKEVVGLQVRSLPSFEGKSTILLYDTEIGPVYVEVMINDLTGK
jgi:two-component system chemotaxis response regulator CheY